MTGAIINTVLAYLLGSVSGSLVVGSWRHVDIRLAGSGNAGGTNAFRTQGFRFALGVVLIDVGKGVIATVALSRISLPGLEQVLGLPAQMALCGFAAVLGHCYPIWHGFRGGKGAATALGVVCVIQPVALIPMLLCWLLVLTLSGWVGLATMLAGLSLVPTMLWLDAGLPYLLFSLSLAGFLVFTHRSNIRNMMGGREFRFERAMLRNWFR